MFPAPPRKPHGSGKFLVCPVQFDTGRIGARHGIPLPIHQLPVILPMLRILREPLLHFLAIGVCIFGFFLATSEQSVAPESEVIVLTDEQIKQFAGQFAAVWRRPPTEPEMTKLIDEFIREEVFVREAVALSLDQNDVVIRRRLRQKMEFLIESSAGALQPSEEELRAFYKASSDSFRRDAKIEFEQVFLGPEPDTASTEAVLADLQAGADPGRAGERTLLPLALPLSGAASVNGTFGSGFFEKIRSFPVGKWRGPVRSGYGLHLIRIVERVEAKLPEFKTVRDAVMREWKRQRVSENADAIFARMRDRYRIVRPDAPSKEGSDP